MNVTETLGRGWTVLCTVLIALGFLQIFFWGLFSVAEAQVPSFINYQSQLLNGADEAISASTTISFSIYSTSTGGTALWTETYNQSAGSCAQVIPDAAGYFATQLGTCISFPTTLDFTQDLYLGVTVAGDAEALPRAQLGVAPYAQTAAKVVGVGQSAIGTTTANASSTLTVAATDTNRVAAIFQAIAGQVADIFQVLSATGEELLTLTATGLFGISTSTPSATLSVGGDAVIDGQLTVTGTTTLATDLTVVNATSTNFSVTTLGINSEYFTDLTGSGLTISSGVLTVDAASLTVATSSVALALNGFNQADYLSLSAWNATSTDALDEGTANLYFTTARASSTALAVLAATTTDALAEGSTALYFTTGRVEAVIGASTSISQLGQSIELGVETTGTLASTSLAGEVLVASELNTEAELEALLSDTADVYTDNDGALDDDDLSDNSTSDLSEGGNLYFTTERASTTALAVLAATTTDALAEGSSNLYWTDERFDARLGATTSLSNVSTLSGLTTIGTSGATTTITGNVVINEGIQLASSTPATTTDALYNQSSTLYWNGYDVLGGSAGGRLAFAQSISAVGATTTLPYQSSVTGVTVSTDGDYMYHGGNGGDVISQYRLTTPFDITSAVYMQGQTTFGFGINGPYDVAFTASGTRMFIMDQIRQDIHQFDLSTAWDVTSHSNQASTSLSQSNGVSGIFFRADGQKLYVVDSSFDEVDEYNLGAAWDITSLSYLQTFSISAQTTAPADVTFRADGYYMYVSDRTGRDVLEYLLSTPWDVSTASFINAIDLSGTVSDLRGLYMTADGARIYTSDLTQERIHQFAFGFTPAGRGLALNSAFYAHATSTFARGLYLGNAPQGTTTNALYSQAGSLYWSGTAIQSALTGSEGQTLVFNSDGEAVATSSLFVANDGQVGIGTTTPTNELTVEGSANITDSLTVGTSSIYIDTDSIDNLSGVLTLQASGATTSLGGALSFNSEIFTDLTGSGLALVSGALTVATSSLAFDPSAINLAQGFLLVGDNSGQASATSSIYLASDGAVGVGTTAPVGRLSVSNEGLTSTWEQIGNDRNISGAGFPTLTTLSTNRVAFFDGGNENLQTYDFDGTTWTQVGNDLNIAGAGVPALTTLSASRVAYIDETLDELRVYDFDGTTWTQVGNSLAISVLQPELTALSSNRVVLIDSGNEEILVYDFDGTNWSQTGTPFALGSKNQISHAKFAPNRIAYFDTNDEELRVYEFNESTWSQVGTSTNIGSTLLPRITVLSPNRVALFDQGTDTLRTYDFDGYAWSQVGDALTIGGVSSWSTITALTPNRIAYFDLNNDDLRTYQFSNPLLYVTDDEDTPFFGVSDNGYTFTESLRVHSGLELFAAATGTFATAGTSSAALIVNGSSFFGNEVEFTRGLTLASSTPEVTAGALYNQSGTLYWDGAALSDTTGIVWNPALVEASGWQDVTYGNGRFVAVANGDTNRVMYSDDGVDWTAASSSEQNAWRSVVYGNGRFVAVAQSGSNRVMYSDNGISWSPASAAEANGWQSVTYGNSRFVAVAFSGTNRVMYSDDGVNWSPASAAAVNSWDVVTYGNGRFVALAYNGTNRVMYSDDGINWNPASASEQNAWLDVVYGNGRFVAVAEGGTSRVMYSDDGINWTAASSSEQNLWQSVAYGDGLYVAVATDGTNPVMYSRDGATWTAAAAPETNFWNAVTYGNGRFVAVASNGTNRAMYSGNILDSTLEPGNIFQGNWEFASGLGIGTTSSNGLLDVWGNFQVGTSSALSVFEVDSSDRTVDINGQTIVTDTFSVAGTSTAFNNFIVNGNIGIGNSAPSTKLDLRSGSGDGITTFQIGDAGYLNLARNHALSPAITTNMSSGNPNMTFANSSGNLIHLNGAGDSYFNGTGLGVGNTSADGMLEVRQTGSDDIFNLYDDSTNVLSVLDGGSVGIGTSNPRTQLDITSAGNHNSPSQTDRILNWYGPGNGGTEVWNASTTIAAGSNATSSSQPASVGLSLYTYDTADNIYAPALTFGGLSTNGSFMNGAAAISALISENTADTNFRSGELTFYTQGDGLSGRGLAERMRIDTDGNVAIGTTTPSATLDVWGDFRVGTSTALSVFDVNSGSRTLNLNGQTTITDTLSVAGTSTALNNFITNGSVGIGTTTLSHTLTVDGSTYTEALEFLDGSIQGLAATPDAFSWNIDTAVAGDTNDISEVGFLDRIRDVWFTPGGFNMLLLVDDDGLVEFSLSTPWDPNSRSLTSATGVSEDSDPKGFFFRSDGRKLYIAGDSLNDINEYDLSTPWDLSTRSFVQKFDVDENSAPNDVFFSPDGRKMYVAGDGSAEIISYELSTPWDVTTASLTYEMNVFAASNEPNDVHFRSDGRIMFVTDNAGNDVDEYFLTTPWDLTTAVDRGRTIAVSGSDELGTYFAPNGERLFVVADDDIYEYGLGFVIDGELDVEGGAEIGDRFGSNNDAATLRVGGRDSTFETSLLIYSSNASDLIQGHWGVEQTFTVTNDGEVGIGTGTSDPSAYLDIDANSSSIEGLSLRQDGTADIVEIFDGGTEVFTILDGGNVGIGDAAPDAKLTIGGLGSDNASIPTTTDGFNMVINTVGNNTGSYGAGLAFSDSDNVTAGILALDDGGGAAVGLTFFTGDSTTVSEAMTIDSNGNVGIGTTTPANTLTVAGDAFVGGGLSVTGTGGGAVGNWTAHSAAGDDDLWFDVTEGDGTFVAVGSFVSDRVITSPDGINWTPRTAAGDNDDWYGVAYGDGTFVAVAQTGGDRVMYSTDNGVTWATTTAAGDDDNWVSVAYGNGTFVAVGNTSGDRVMTSSDGITWLPRSAVGNNDDWNDVVYGEEDGLFVAVGIDGDRVMTSSDGISWTAQSAADDDDEWSAVTYDGSQYVAVGGGGSGGDQIMTSPDGVTWTVRTSPDTSNWGSVAYGNGLYVAVANTDTRAMYSTDGAVTWVGEDPVGGDDSWLGLTYGAADDTFVAVGAGSDYVMTMSPQSGTFVVNQTGSGDVLNVFNDTEEVFTISGGGNVGVGSNAPTHTLTVDGSIYTRDALVFADGSMINSAVNFNGLLSGSITTMTYRQATSTDEDPNTRDVFFKPDGTKMYVVGHLEDEINEYDLTTPWDVSTASYLQNIDVNDLPGNSSGEPTGLYIRADGMKAYTTDGFDKLNEYDFGTAWDITTLTNTVEEALPASGVKLGIWFSPDGRYLYLSDDGDEELYQYELSTPWDITTRTEVATALLNGSTFNPRGISFTADGSRMYLVNDTGVNAEVREYRFTTPWDVTTMYNSGNTYRIEDLDDEPEGIFVRPDLTTVYVSGDENDQVYEFSLGVTAPNGVLTIDSTVEILENGALVMGDGSTAGTTRIGGSFSGGVSSLSFVQSQEITEDDRPSGVWFKPDGTKMYIVGDTGAEINEYNLATPWDVSTESIDFQISISSLGSLSETDPYEIYMRPDGKKVYILGLANDYVIEYDLTTPWDISTIAYNDHFSYVSQTTFAGGFTMSPDGTKFYVVDGTTEIVYAYNLGNAWDISTASFDNSYDASAYVSLSGALAASNDGYTMYIGDFTDDAIVEFRMDTPWDVSSMRYLDTYSGRANGLGQISGLYVRPDSEKLYLTIDDGSIDEVHEYTMGISDQDGVLTVGSSIKLTAAGAIEFNDGSTIQSGRDNTAFLGSAATLNQVVQHTIAELASHQGPDGFYISPDGLNLYTMDANSEDVHQFTLATPWSIVSESYVREFDADKGGNPDNHIITFRPDGLKMYVGRSALDEYDLSTAWDVSTAVLNDTSASFSTSMEGGTFKSDGTKFFTVSGTDLYEHTFATPWDVSVISASTSYALSEVGFDAYDIQFNGAGTKMYILDDDGFDYVQEYNLTTPWDVSTRVHVEEHQVNGNIAPRGLFVNVEATKLYFSGNEGGIEEIIEYDFGLTIGGNVGILNNDPGVALHVGSTSVANSAELLRLEDTNSVCNFDADSGTPTCGSDETLKKNILYVDEGNLELIAGLETVTYNWLTDDEDAEPQFGFIAQDVQLVIPSLVSTSTWIDGEEKLFLNIGEMTPYLVGAVGELERGLTNENAPLELADGSPSFAARFFERLITWFADTANGIGDFFAGRIVVENEICIDGECLDGDDVRALLELVESGAPAAVIESESEPDEESAAPSEPEESETEENEEPTETGTTTPDVPDIETTASTTTNNVETGTVPLPSPADEGAGEESEPETPTTLDESVDLDESETIIEPEPEEETVVEVPAESTDTTEEENI